MRYFQAIFTPRRLVTLLLISLSYFVFSALLINYRLILTVLTDASYPLNFKFQMTNSLLFGTLLSMPLSQMILQSAIALLVGINIIVLALLVRKLKDQRDLKLTTGGSTIVALVSAGCAHCGVSVLSILGVSSALLPIRGAVLQYLSLGLLAFSLAYSVIKLRQAHCKIS